MAAAGFEVARWFVFTDGRGGVDWNASGELAGIADRFYDDMDAALEIAACDRTCGCASCSSTSRGSTTRRGEPRSNRRPSSIACSIRSSIVTARSDAIHSFDVINEPDWVTESWPTDPKRGVGRSIGCARSPDRCRPHPRTIARAGHARRRTRAVRDASGTTRPTASTSCRCIRIRMFAIRIAMTSCSAEPRRASG